MSRCLICGGVASSTPSGLQFNHNLLNNGLSSISGIKRISLFHKILKIPLSKCLPYLEMSEGGQTGGQEDHVGKMTFCDGCGPLVDEGDALVELMDKLESQMKGVQFKITALLLNQQTTNQGSEGHQGQENDIRSTLIKEIFLELKPNQMGSGERNQNEGLRSRGQSQSQLTEGDEVELLDEEEEDGIGIITGTTSMATSYQVQGQSQDVIVEVEEDVQEKDPLGVSLNESDESCIPNREEITEQFHYKVDPWTGNNANFGVNYSLDDAGEEEEEEFYIQSHDEGGQDVDFQDEENDESVLDETVQGSNNHYRKASTEVSASFLSLYAELDAQKYSKKPNKVKVAPPSPLPSRKIQPPLRLQEQEEEETTTDKYSQIKLGSSARVKRVNLDPLWSIQKNKNKVLKRKFHHRRPAERNWICVLCDRKCDTAFQLGNHYSSFHGNPTSWPCLSCSQLFHTKERLYSHRKNFHKNLPINAQLPQLKKRAVVTTPKVMAKVASLEKNGIKIGQNQETASGSGTCITPSTSSTANGTQPHVAQRQANFVCVLCDEVLVSGTALGAHYSSAHGNKPIWSCKECGEEFNERCKLYYHRRFTHHNLPINQRPGHVKYVTEKPNAEPCRTGDRVALLKKKAPPPPPVVVNMPSTPTVKRKRTKKKKRIHKFICLLCDMDCRGTILMSRHYHEVHPNTTEWPCSICHQVFDRRQSLYIHRKEVHKTILAKMREYVGIPAKKKVKINPATAAGLPMKANVKEAKVNTLKHPMKVDIKGTKAKVTTLNGKLKTRWNYTCVICGEDCKHSTGVTNHYKLAHPTLSKCLKCSKCYKTFPTYNSLFTHQRHHHKDNKTEIAKGEDVQDSEAEMK